MDQANNQNMDGNDQLDDFVMEVLKEAGTLMEGNDDFNETLVDQFKNQLIEHLGARSFGALSPEKQEKVMKLQDDETLDDVGLQEKVQSIFQENISDYENFVIGALNEFADMYVEKSRELKS